jgi:hypothetical protein
MHLLIRVLYNNEHIDHRSITRYTWKPGISKQWWTGGHTKKNSPKDRLVIFRPPPSDRESARIVVVANASLCLLMRYRCIYDETSRAKVALYNGKRCTGDNAKMIVC